MRLSGIRLWAAGIAVAVMVAAVSGTAVVLGTASGRTDRPVKPQGAASVVPAQPPGSDATSVATASATIDTSLPLWGIPYREADAAKPRFDQEINGIKVGPTVKISGAPFCYNTNAAYVGADEAALSPLDFTVTQMPPGFALDRETIIACSGRVAVVEREYVAMPAPGIESKIASGEISWFDAQHGGKVSVSRSYADYPALTSGISADRWSAGTVNGRPAAVGRPILDGGFGDSALVVWDDGVQLTLTGLEVKLSDLMRVAQEVLE